MDREQAAPQVHFGSRVSASRTGQAMDAGLGQQLCDHGQGAASGCSFQDGTHIAAG